MPPPARGGGGEERGGGVVHEIVHRGRECLYQEALIGAISPPVVNCNTDGRCELAGDSSLLYEMQHLCQWRAMQGMQGTPAPPGGGVWGEGVCKLVAMHSSC